MDTKYILIKARRYIFLMLLGFMGLGITSCSKDDGDTATVEGVDPFDNRIIYVVGHENDETTNRSIATLWVNGEATHLTESRAHVHSYANTIFVDGDDIYVGGRIGSSTVLWKNGEPTNLWGEGIIESIIVSNGNVYAAGIKTDTNYQAVLWINGELTILSDPSNEAWALSMAISDNDIYIAGYESNGAYKVAKLWINGQPTDLSDGTKNESAASVKIYNGDVYVAGGESIQSMGTTAKLWKNGIPEILENNNYGANVYAMDVWNGNTYIVGFENKSTWHATGWFNENKLDAIPHQDYFSIAQAVQVLDGDVFVAGRSILDYRSNNEAATIWVNGNTRYLTDFSKDAWAADIFVKNK